ncbi:hypothetical protein [Demetria terragena]|uniref:hypothetical protein n=1 Tax=Demetria terragena TaxID=63959 RepID=UPI000373A9EC|nr:hypothetical protein [Demetria terragena]
MSVGQLRQTLFTIWLASAAGAFAYDTFVGPNGRRFTTLLMIAMVILALPTLRIGRLQGTTSLAGLGIAAPSVVYFVLGLTGPLLLIVHSAIAGAVWVGLVVAYIWFERAARGALEAQSATLHTSRGDADVGAFTAFTPMALPPTTRPEPKDAKPHSHYDPRPVRDWTER